MKRMSFVLALILAIAAPAFAQIQSGSINGTVKDEQGGVLPGVTVTAQGLDATQQKEEESGGAVEDPDPLVVHGREPAPQAGLLGVSGVGMRLVEGSGCHVRIRFIGVRGGRL